VKAHIERRFSMSYEHPAAKLRDYVLAMRAIFRAFQGEERLNYEGDFYSFTLLTDFFSPGPSDHPDIPLSVAGVNVGMARLAGEVFDGFHVHPFHSPRYLDERILPAIAAGAAAAGRSATDVEIICPVFTIVGDDESERAAARESVRRQLAFYGSTRTYRPVFELHGWADASDELHRLMAARDTDAMAAVITDAMLDEYAVTATWDELPAQLLERYRGRADRLFTYQPAVEWLRSPLTTERWREVAAQVRSG
jgi:probable F420-dependent oxidoreductase